MLLLNYKQIKATNEVFKKLNKLRRWTDIISKGTYNELNKQALNCMIAYILASYAEHEGIYVTWERFPKIALYRAFQKVYVVFNTPKQKYDEIFKYADISKNQLDLATKKKITELTDAEYANFLCDSIGTQEEKLYRAATKIATYIECKELANQYSLEEAHRKLRNISDETREFDYLPGFKEIFNPDGEIFQLLQFISSSGLRNHIRWCEHGYLQECSILGHLFDTACFSYFISLEQEPNNEKLATDRFFMGIYHDLAEVWTTDIPSPIKDAIPGLREATEKYERKMLENNLYAVVPEFLAKRLKEIMFEEPENVKKHKAVIKGGDYLSADSECWRQYVLGTRDPYFKEAIEKRVPGIESGEVALTPACKQLFNYFRQYADKLKLDDLEDDSL